MLLSSGIAGGEAAADLHELVCGGAGGDCIGSGSEGKVETVSGSDQPLH